MQFTGQFGFKILNEARAYYENNSINYNRLQSVLEAPYGDRTLAGNQKQTFVSYYLENGDFLKLTNLTFGYTVPLKKNKFVNNIRAYFSAENSSPSPSTRVLIPSFPTGMQHRPVSSAVTITPQYVHSLWDLTSTSKSFDLNENNV